ncbi:MAG: GNAT family N-acetyltransferase [Betaproteobacteria bacterium]
MRKLGFTTAATIEHPMTIRETTDADQHKWDSFCLKYHASYAYLFDWKQVLYKLGKIPVYLIAEGEGGVVIGCLPLVVSKNIFFSRAVSTFGEGHTHGGPIASDPDVHDALLEVAQEVLLERNVSWALMSPDPTQGQITEVQRLLRSKGYEEYSSNASDGDRPHIYQIPLRDFAAVWKETIAGKVRNQTRKAIKSGVAVRSVSEEEFLKPFFQIQRQVWDRLGNSCPDYNRFEIALNVMRPIVRMYLAEYEGQIVGGLYCFYANNVCFLRSAVTIDAYQSLCVNNLLYMTSIEDACNSGIQVYDMGSSPPPNLSGHHLWKMQYGGIPFPLTYYKKILRPLEYYADRLTNRTLAGIRRKISYCDQMTIATKGIKYLQID